MTIALSGYQVIAQIYESANSHVYRGIRSQDKQPVILKVLKQDYPTPAELTRYKQEYEITRRLNADGVVKAYELQKYQNTLVMILEDFGGKSLEKMLRERQFTLSEFLDLAIRITSILGDIHAANIIHKDINPANIVFNPRTGELKIIDFGIASILTRENTALKNPNVLEGTLAYISPEQTGRMNRSLDYRSDFYSLGATFYELLTGRVPFETADAMELVHCHIAISPVPPHKINPEIPQAISNIVMKMLAKTAEERYKSAWGIKADLEACLTQLQTQGIISEFTLGSQDISDKFQIPQKLYGREEDVETLLDAFERVAQTGKVEFMMVAGYSGIGKSSLVQELFKPITAHRGYFISGKFDQFQRNIPYSAVVAAFEELVRQLLTESEAELNRWRSEILAAVGQNGQVIIDVIPEVELIIGPQPAVPELGPTETQNRFNLVLGKFIRVFCQQHHPFVIFLDDLQWADSATLKLIELIVTDTDSHSLLLLGAYRDNEVSPTHPLMTTIDRLRPEGVTINEITLTNLSLSHIAQSIADTLHSDSETVTPLAELVLKKTEGNPFFANEFLLTLYQENLLTFNIGQRSWQWDIAEIEAVGITDNVVNLMIGKLQKLPDATQQVLCVAACVGNQFDLNTLSIVQSKSAAEIFGELLPAMQLGLIQPTSSLETTDLVEAPLLIFNYKFGHDRIQQAADALLDAAQRKNLHLDIGRLLLANIDPAELEERIFDIVNHLNIGLSLVGDRLFLEEIAQLNLKAAIMARRATAYEAAREYLCQGMGLLPADAWESMYETSFQFYRERAQCEYLLGNTESSDRFLATALQRTTSKLDAAELYDLQLQVYFTQGKFSEGVRIGKESLKMFGVSISDSDAQIIEMERHKSEYVRNLLAEKSPSDILAMESMTDPVKMACMKLIVFTFAHSLALGKTHLVNLLTLIGVELSLLYGNCDISAYTYCGYGMMLAGTYGDYSTAYSYGILSLELNKNYHNSSLTGKVLNYFCNFMNPFCRHIKSSLTIYQTSYNSCRESGDVIFGVWAAILYVWHRFVKGDRLSEVAEECENYYQFVYKSGDRNVLNLLLLQQRIVLNLKGETSNKNELSFPNCSEAESVASLQESRFDLGVTWYVLFKLQILLLYDDREAALRFWQENQAILAAVLKNWIMETEVCFYAALAIAACYPTVAPEEKDDLWQTLESQARQLQIWAESCPENFLHKYLLVAAEMARISGKEFDVMDLYDRAIASARENEFVQNEALANELAAKFWLSKGKEEFAQLYMQKAHYGYQIWGAGSKVEYLQEKYPQLLGKTPTASHLTTIHTTSTQTATGGSNVLDFTTFMKAGQAISGELVLDKLLSKLMKILVENAGARLGCLLLPKEGKLLLEAKATVDPEAVVVQQSQPVAEVENLPVTVINYVERSRSDVVLSNAAASGQFTKDPYIARQQLKSLLCTPIVKGGKLIGILYLENNLTTGAFTPERLEVLRLLSAQAAISLENALLYTSVEQKVQQRTSELNEKNLHLEQTLEKLKRTQAQLIHTEKMSSLGQLVAGVAHEINNPVSFIFGNISHANEYFQDLLDMMQLYGQHYPEPVDEISEALEEIDLEFLIEDWQKLMGSMKMGAQRIGDIVRGLRNFSRLDESSMKPVDIHEGLDSTLLMLQSRLRNDSGAGIEVIKEYGQLPLVTCYASHLNQVFMNILNNAIDALSRPSDVTDKVPAITIRTEVTGADWVKICIADNGAGITESVQQKIFDPFFTTKPVGAGTGLGLSTSYSIVVNKHGGKLHCISAPGQGAEFVIEIPIQPRQVMP